MKATRLLAILLMWFAWQPIFSQTTYYSNTDASNLGIITINGSTCTSSIVGPFTDAATGNTVGSGDIAVCGDGTIYICDNFSIYSVDPATAVCTQLASNSNSFVMVAMCCGPNGLIYGSGYDFSGSGPMGPILWEIDVVAGTFTILGVLPFDPSGDLVFYDGILYMTSIQGLVEVDVANPGNSTLLFATNPSLFGLGPYMFACNTLVAGDGNGALFLLDLSAQTEEFLCTASFVVGGLATVDEFLPPPGCITEIDLDLNDSSGALNFDYNANAFSCLTPGGVNVADIDTDIESTAAISQLTLNLLDILDAGQESLELGPLPNIQVLGSGTPSLTLINQGTATVNDFINAVEAVLYQHTANPLSPGQRRVEVIFSTVTGEVSNTATAFIDVLQLTGIQADLGPDLELCPNETTQLDAGVPLASYFWSTQQTSQTITVASAGLYSVTVSDGINCPGSDEVLVNVLPQYTVFLNGTESLCENETGELVINTNAPDLIDVTIESSTGPPIVLTGVQNGVVLPVNPASTTTYTITSVSSNTFDACFSFSDNQTLAVFPNFFINANASICEGEFIILEGAPQTTPGTYTDQFQSVNGCDSTVITTLNVFPLSTTELETTTCFELQAGEFTVVVPDSNGCDSTVVTTVVYVGSPLTFDTLFTCDPAEVGTGNVTLTNAFGCDSTVVLTTLLQPSDITTINTTTCDPGQVGSSQEMLVNQFGCDSIIVTNTTFSASDTTLVDLNTCDLSEAGTVESFFLNELGCDSVVITTTTYIPLDTTFIELATCDPDQAGVEEVLLSNSFGCDSLIITTINLLPTDITELSDITCDPQQAGITEEVLTNQFGCDSLVITTSILILPDTTLLANTSCDPNQVGIEEIILTNQSGCDSLIITSTTFAEADTTGINLSTCDPMEVGIFEEMLTNQLGCDSLVITTVSLLSSDTTELSLTSCDVAEVGVFEEMLTNQLGCDSLVITTVSLLSSDTTELSLTSCDVAEVGVFEEMLTNQLGCDSLVITTVSLLSSDTTELSLTSCDVAEVGVFEEMLTNQLGCDSLVITTVSLLSSDTTELSLTSCDVAEVGVFEEMLTNQLGCDSLVITTVSLLSSDTTELSLTSCDVAEVGVFEEMLTNQLGCDSLVITTVSLLSSDTTELSLTSCDVAEVGVFEEMLTNQLGCDSLVITTVSLLSSDTTFLFGVTCIPEEAGIFSEVYANQVGCDSLVILEIVLLNTPQTVLTETTCDPSEEGVFEEIYAAANGCDSVVTIVVTLLPEEECNETESTTVYAPNAFSPNGDGFNDEFTLFAENGTAIIRHLRIFSRWGELLFDGADLAPGDLARGWDGTFQGKAMDPGVYIYFADIEFADGRTRILKGDLTLIR
jgi:gliding motility-associated-like protein